MKYELPINHNLSDSIIAELVFKEESGNPALTDAQFAALDAGLGSGKSLLIVSPTSTGKTQIAVWAIAKGIETGCNIVYLVTLRALAKQKFDDFKDLLLDNFLDGNNAALAIATGDYVINAEGDNIPDPLHVPLLVATYEKYLALLSASGIPSDMGKTVVVCDEIQLIGDKTRGQNVEILLTILRNAGWKQFVGLSAVLESRDANDLANWLGVTLVTQQSREKHLRYECWTQNGVIAVTSEQPEIQENLPIPTGVSLTPVSILASLLKQSSKPVPIIVFCMRKQDMYDLAEELLSCFSKIEQTQLSIAFDELPETAANTFLARAMAHNVAIHSADLVDEERHVVEKQLLDGKIDIVFATSTLAAGVNFPLGAAIFAGWERWDGDKRAYFPIETSEFHNMAGRVGRMGFDHEQGRVIFLANGSTDIFKAKQYLNLGAMPLLESRVSPQRFNQLALQLVASGLCNSRESLEQLICTTLSALREQDRNNTRFLKWSSQLSDAINQLINDGLFIQTSTGVLSVTKVGKAIGYSALLPETGVFLLNYAVNKVENLIKYLPKYDNAGDMARFAYLIFCTCFSAPEFRPFNQKQPPRFLPWPLNSSNPLFNAEVYLNDLPEPTWYADIIPINAAKLAIDWISGDEISSLEKTLPKLSAGMLREMFRNLVWALQGFSAIISAATDSSVPILCRPKLLHDADSKIELLKKLPRVIERLSLRVAEGLPDNALWMMSLNVPNSSFRLSRHEIITLLKLDYSTPERVMLSSLEANGIRLKAFAKVKPAPQAKANWLLGACRDWKLNQRKRAAEKHSKRARNCPNLSLIKAYYNNKGTEFESAFENILSTLNIKFEKLDDKTKTGAPDYLVSLKDSPELIIELKSKQGDNLVNYNTATEVLAASEIHGYKNTFCVTLCHPGVDPSVPMVIVNCGRLSVVESHDLGEALLRICEGKLTQSQLYQWLATPGQALIADLPFSS